MRSCSLPIFLLLLITGFVPASAQEAALRGTIIDAVTGRQTPATVCITDSHGNVVIESDSFKSGFRCAGRFSKRLPPGRAHVRITRGFEFMAVDRDLDLLAGREMEVTFQLRRSVDLRQRGWFAGDSHVHMLHGERAVPVDFDDVALAAQAEDLQYLSLAQNWTIEPATPEALEAQLRSRSRPDCVLTWNLEAPKNYYKGDAGRCLGHCWNVGMGGRTREGMDVIRVLLDASAWDYESSKPTFANFESHQLVHEQGGAVVYSHPARWWMGPWGGQGGYPKVEQMRISNLAVELPLDTLVGPTFDGVDVLTTAGEAAANAKAFELWSLLLNHGYRLAATASSDACFDRPGGGVPGAVRVYTYVPDGFSISKIVRAMAAGRNFVSSGPLLLATIDGKPPGSAFAADGAPHALAIEAWAGGSAALGLGRLELLRNGRPCQQLDLRGQPDTLRTNLTVREAESAWYCVRVSGHDAQQQIAISGAFYFADKAWRPPVRVQAQVHARIEDGRSGRLLAGTLTEVTFAGTIGRGGKRHELSTGEARLAVPGTVRLRAEAKGYAPLTLSPFLDCPDLVRTVTGLSDADLVDWKTFERLKDQLAEVELVFQLEK